MNALPTIVITLAAAALPAADKRPGSDPDLPQPFDAGIAQPVLENSPFTRALNLSDSLTLTGLAYIQGKPVATVFDKSKKASYLVSEEPNAQGWKLAEASASTAISRSQAKIMVGNEVVTVRYAAEQISPEEMKKNRRPSDRGPGPPPPPDAGGPPRREFRGPSEEDRRRYESLSERGKEKLRDFFRESREKLMNASPEERMNFIRSNFDRIEKEDRGGK